MHKLNIDMSKKITLSLSDAGKNDLLAFALKPTKKKKTKNFLLLEIYIHSHISAQCYILHTHTFASWKETNWTELKWENTIYQKYCKEKTNIFKVFFVRNICMCGLNFSFFWQPPPPLFIYQYVSQSVCLSVWVLHIQSASKLCIIGVFVNSHQ